ncbi:MAG: hypothetical protein ACTHNU_08885, partial [Gaiellales bacterium]
KEATDNFSFLVELINTADGSVRSLETTPGHSAGGLQGAKLSWDHVLLGLNMFHPAQAAAVPGLATTILATREVAIQWGNALNGVTPHTSHHELTVRFAPVVKLEVKARKPLNATAAALARMACSLERKSTLLASQPVLHDDCANAASLSKRAKG